MYFTNEEIEGVLGMKYDPKFKYDNENILCSDIFTIENYKTMSDEKGKWKYQKEKFQWGRANKKLWPSLMIYLILATYKYKKVIPSNMYEDVVMSRYNLCGSPLPYTDDQIRIGRSYQTYASYLREIDLINNLIKEYPDIKIYKNPYMDLCEGIDFVVEYKGITKYIALKHEGHTSDKYDRMWKNDKEEKSQYDITRLTAPHNKGCDIELVELKDIKELFNE